ncbi:hypothetical protein PUN28_003243 [Cardiocondyla obscurior]|uniref:Uncharacterized protein n=1 Tax=Cardiocondyla obscurior TaxID=286306 RepID=A0AAW2GNF7_9HYME
MPGCTCIIYLGSHYKIMSEAHGGGRHLFSRPLISFARRIFARLEARDGSANGMRTTVPSSFDTIVERTCSAITLPTRELSEDGGEKKNRRFNLACCARDPIPHLRNFCTIQTELQFVLYTQRIFRSLSFLHVLPSTSENSPRIIYQFFRCRENNFLSFPRLDCLIEIICWR